MMMDIIMRRGVGVAVDEEDKQIDLLRHLDIVALVMKTSKQKKKTTVLVVVVLVVAHSEMGEGCPLAVECQTHKGST